MRIIIVQAEIELAIRQYILGQIAIKDGQDITIDFKNTRGDDGATAEINIQTPAPNATQPVVQSRLIVQTTKTPPTISSVAAAPAVTATEAVTTEDVSSADSASTTSEVVQQEPNNPEPETIQPEPAVEEKSPVPSFLKNSMDAVTGTASSDAPSKSLFANLTKPVNTKPAE